MPATTTRPVTPAQQRFVASLAAERTLDERQRNLVTSAAQGTLSAATTSSLIDELLAAPRQATVTGVRATANVGNQDGVRIASPTAQSRAGRMLGAGGVEATVTLDDGRHVTLSIRTRARVGRGWTNANPTDEGARTTIKVHGNRVGWINVTDAAGGHEWQLTLRTRRPEYVTAVNAVLAYAAGLALPTGAKRVQEASRCGRCFRTLTDPVSIDRGIGPECLGRVTGSRHVNAENSAGINAVANPEAAVQSLNVIADALTTPVLTEAEQRAADLRNEVADIRQRELDAAAVALPSLSGDKARARDLIAEALDAYCTDHDRDFAMRIFDQLAAR